MSNNTKSAKSAQKNNNVKSAADAKKKEIISKVIVEENHIDITPAAETPAVKVNNRALNVVYISEWLPVDQCKAKIEKLIAKKLYTKEQLNLSSFRFANNKDKSEGYMARVMARPGICPELELATKGEIRMNDEQKKLLNLWRGFFKNSKNIVEMTETMVKFADGSVITLTK